MHTPFRRLPFLLAFAALFATAARAQFPTQEDLANPSPHPDAVVEAGKARFTVLTSGLVRMEWSPDSTFEDRASLVVINRRLDPPGFESMRVGEWLVIETERMRLRYKLGSGAFGADNLEVAFEADGEKTSWTPGKENLGNLGGTNRTLDGVKGAAELNPGLLSTEGWTLIDDSDRPLLDSSDRKWFVERADTSATDWYLFVYDDDYKRALADYVAVAGRVPLPPRFAFGLWQSRYWAYTDREFKQLVEEFDVHDVPLDVLVIDMDWHKTYGLTFYNYTPDQAGQHLGWTGYTWDPNHFPDPEAFLDWCERRGLKTPLNLHPASGVQPHEERYPEMARAMGIDPATERYVPFDITDKKYAKNYFEILHRPKEEIGVDFWWLDWQQWQESPIRNLNNTWALNYAHFTDMERQGKRPIIYHRWGGLGNHRYQIGFSGDVHTSWESLAFQPFFTAAASNVCYGYWSHDIGGHFEGEREPEIQTRWVQYGVFSPILRLHSAKSPRIDRRPWTYPLEHFQAMREAIRLRYRLAPYVYAAARETYETGVSIVRPMYYEHPREPEAYERTRQYYFGDDMIVAPVVSPIDDSTGMATVEVWLPEGAWHDWATGEALVGPAAYERPYALDEIPVFVKRGAVVPMQTNKQRADVAFVDPAVFVVFPGDSGSAELYEDSGDSLGYREGEYARTRVTQRRTGRDRVSITIDATLGEYRGQGNERTYVVELLNALPPAEVYANGEPLAHAPYGGAGWRYDGYDVKTIVEAPRSSIREPLEIDIVFPDADPNEVKTLLDGFKGRQNRLVRARPLMNRLWSRAWSPDELIYAVQTGNRIELWPDSALVELRRFRANFADVLDAMFQRRRYGWDLTMNAIRRVQPHAPVVEAAQSHFLDNLAITIVSPDPDANVFYTLDGSTPTLESIRYDEPFAIDRTTRVRAKAFPPNEINDFVFDTTFVKLDLSPAVDPSGERADGLRYEVFETRANFVPDFDTLEVAASGVAPAPSADGLDSPEEFFAVRFTGYIEVPEDGIYEFWTTSNEGSRLWIDDVEVVENDGRHGADTKSGKIALAKGAHMIRVGYFQYWGRRLLEVGYRAPSGEETPLTEATLFHIK
ncbi:MAG: DUF5110 domain-containing protein [Ignavibacteriales bacterium]|nr:DUF5110 domain-containing protein [Ignavibacteriales bacterium]